MSDQTERGGRGCGSGKGRGRGGPGRGCGRAEGPFRRRGIRMTLTRQIIITALEKNEGFLTAEELYFLVREAYPGIGIATVYRTLQLLEELSLVNRVETGDGKARYSMHRQETQSDGGVRAEVLLVCDRCGKLIRQHEYTKRCEPLLAQLAEEVKDEHRFKAGHAVVQVHGLCGGCGEG